MSSSTSSSSRRQTQKRHDVFLSFRGEDTRDNFTSHLFAGLERWNIPTYMDDARLNKGDDISPALVKAITDSKISVVVFSKNYASSTWCLDELVHILSCGEKYRQIVIPIFYNVTPSDVRKQEGSFATAFLELERRFKNQTDKISQWRKALKTIGSLSGWDSSVTKPDAILVDKIVEDVQKKLKSNRCENMCSPYIGIDKHIEEIESVLCNTPPDMGLCIWGERGIGKTTLARVIFDRISFRFNVCCFVDKVEEQWKTLGDAGLRRHVLSILLKEKRSEKDICMSYENELRNLNVLLVLDDLTDLNRLRLLQNRDWFGHQSRIIITTRDEYLLVKDPICNYSRYKLKGLNDDEALLLYLHKRNPAGRKIESKELKESISSMKGNPETIINCAKCCIQ